MKTHRDDFVIGFSEQEVKNRIMQFRNKNIADVILRQTFNLKDSSSWQMKAARKYLSDDMNWQAYFQKILYRPFDHRIIYYHDKLIDRSRFDVMHNILRENLGLCFMRQFSGVTAYSHFLITSFIVDNRTFFSSKGTIQFAPLYIFPSAEKINLFSAPANRETNIPPFVFKKLLAIYRRKPSPEDILFYMYGVFYSNIYRKTYAEFLRIDFPRVPFTANYDLFLQMAHFGQELADLHLLKNPALASPVARYQGSGDNDRIEKVIYKEDEQCIYINIDKYFEGIAPEVWNYHIGGYQVLQKYLKDRKGRPMDDAPRYCRIVTALSKTIEIQKRIDEIYPEIEKKIIEF